MWACDMVMWYWSADTLFWLLLIDHDMDVQYQRCKLALPIILNWFLEYGRHVGATSSSSVPHAPASHAASHDDHGKPKLWVCFLWVQGSALPPFRPLGAPLQTQSTGASFGLPLVRLFSNAANFCSHQTKAQSGFCKTRQTCHNQILSNHLPHSHPNWLGRIDGDGEKPIDISVFLGSNKNYSQALYLASNHKGKFDIPWVISGW